MSVEVKLNFQTDFSRFLVSDQINHTVKVVTSESVIECSGIILAQHSATLQKLVSDDNEIFLDNYTNVKDCLLVLHGGIVTLTLDNILDIMKFSVQFEIDDMLSPCLQWLENNINRENFLVVLKICNSVSNMAKSCGIDLKENLFQSCKFLLKIEGPPLISSMLHEENANTQTAISNFMKFLEDGFIHFLPLLTDHISASNVSWVIDSLTENASNLIKYSDKEKINSVLVKIESFVGDVTINRKFIDLRHSLLKNTHCSCTSPCLISRIIPDGNKWIKDSIFEKKIWKIMDFDQIIQLQALFTDEEHFLYSEIVIEWVIEKKPTKDTFECLARSIMPCLLNADYIEVLNEKYEALGYNSVVPASLLANWKRPSHFISSVTNHSGNTKKWNICIRVSCRNECPQKNDSIITLHFKPPNSLNVVYLKTQIGYLSLICPTDAREGAVNFYFYAIGHNGEHFPFHTDFQKLCPIIHLVKKIGFMPYSV